MRDQPAHRPSSHEQQYEAVELLGVLRDAGNGPLLDALNDPDLYTSRGRFCLVRAAAAVGLSTWQLRQRLLAMRTMLGGCT